MLDAGKMVNCSTNNMNGDSTVCDPDGNVHTEKRCKTDKSNQNKDHVYHFGSARPYIPKPRNSKLRTRATQTEFLVWMKTKGTNTKVSRALMGITVGHQTEQKYTTRSVKIQTEYRDTMSVKVQTDKLKNLIPCKSVDVQTDPVQSLIVSKLPCKKMNTSGSVQVQTDTGKKLIGVIKCKVSKNGDIVQTDQLESFMVPKIPQKISRGTQNPDFNIEKQKESRNVLKSSAKPLNQVDRITEDVMLDNFSHVVKRPVSMNNDMLSSSCQPTEVESQTDLDMTIEEENFTAPIDFQRCDIDGVENIVCPKQTGAVSDLDNQPELLQQVKCENVKNENTDHVDFHQPNYDSHSSQCVLPPETITSMESSGLMSLGHIKCENNGEINIPYITNQQQIYIPSMKDTSNKFSMVQLQCLPNIGTQTLYQTSNSNIEEKTETYCKLHESLLVNKDNWKFSGLFKTKKIQMINSEKIRFVRVYESDNPNIELSVTIEFNFEAKVCVHGRPLSTSHDLWIGQPIIFNNEEVIFKFLRKISGYVTCMGNPESEYLPYLPYNSTSSLISLPIIKAYTEQDYGAVVGNTRYTSTRRSFNCMLLIQKSDLPQDIRCQPCSGIRDQLNSFMNH